MNKVVLSCKKATELVEKKQGGKLSFKEALQLNLHLLMCDACKAYEKQSKLISKALDKFYTETPEKEVVKNDALKKKIISKL